MARNLPDKKTASVEWEAPEYEYHEKDASWYMYLGLVSLFLIVGSLFLGNLLFAIFIIIAGILLVGFSRREPDVLRFRIEEKGVAIGDDIFHDFDTLVGFGVFEREHGLDEIAIHKKRLMAPMIKMPIDSRTLPRAVRALKKHLPEEEYDESIIDALSDRLRI